jgi:hypothetical protein
MAARFSSAVSLFEVDPDLIQHLDPEQAPAARSRAVAPATICAPASPIRGKASTARTVISGRQLRLLLDGANRLRAHAIALPRAVGRYFEGEATSEVGLRRDVWTAVAPDVGAMQRMIAGLDRRSPLATGRSQRLLLAALAARYEARPPPAIFRLSVSPLVEWIWLGRTIAGIGGLLALWPATAIVRRRAAVLSRVGLGQQPSHAQ